MIRVRQEAACLRNGPLNVFRLAILSHYIAILHLALYLSAIVKPISYTLPTAARVTLAINDAAGKRVRNLLPARGKPTSREPAFLDTRPEGPDESAALRQLVSSRRPTAWAESAVDLELGTDIMEYPDDTAADLMDEFFAQEQKRAA